MTMPDSRREFDVMKERPPKLDVQTLRAFPPQSGRWGRFAPDGHLLGDDPRAAADLSGTALGASTLTVGIIEGIAEATASIVKVSLRRAE